MLVVAFKPSLSYLNLNFAIFGSLLCRNTYMSANPLPALLSPLSQPKSVWVVGL